MDAEKRENFITWAKELSVGIEELDDHHKEMIELINRLYKAINKNRGTEEVGKVVRDLLDYANYHFGAEEALFEIKHYPDAALHTERHLEFRENLSELRDLIEAGDESAPARLMEFLFSWWTQHIVEYDKKYSPFLRD
jgi:hemerythrin